MIHDAVHTSGLSKRYGNGVLAVDGLDLRVRRGEVYGFLGPNGAGKTTTLKMLLGLIRPTSGQALVMDRPPGDAKGLARVGALVESPAFYPYLSGRDNLRVIAHSCGLPGSRVEAALQEVDLGGRARDGFQTYSLGMKQRLGVAAALVKEPDLLILDEPTNGLDPQGMVEMRHLIRELGRGERTVLLSSHLLNEVEHMCDRVGVIVNGKLVAEGTVADVRGRSAALILRAQPVDRARALLEEVAGSGTVSDQDGLLRVSVDPARAGEVNRRLVVGGVDVTELRPAERSLEEVFLQLTEGSTL